MQHVCSRAARIIRLGFGLRQSQLSSGWWGTIVKPIEMSAVYCQVIFHFFVNASEHFLGKITASYSDWLVTKITLNPAEFSCFIPSPAPDSNSNCSGLGQYGTSLAIVPSRSINTHLFTISLTFSVSCNYLPPNNIEGGRR